MEISGRFSFQKLPVRSNEVKLYSRGPGALPSGAVSLSHEVAWPSDAASACEAGHIHPLRGGLAKTAMSDEIIFDHGFPAAASTEAGEAQRRALDDAFSLAYEELRSLARKVKRNDPRASLTPTALVNEVWIKLARGPSLAATSPLHFRRIAARAMRQVLVDAARRRHAQARGGGVDYVTFDEAVNFGALSAKASDREVLALDHAIDALAKLNARQAVLVEARFFGGLETAEVAKLLGISEGTALRDWRAAKAWLALEIRRSLK